MTKQKAKPRREQPNKAFRRKQVAFLIDTCARLLGMSRTVTPEQSAAIRSAVVLLQGTLGGLAVSLRTGEVK